MVLNGSNPRQIVQRGGEPLLTPTKPWELQAGGWNWTQAMLEGHVPMIGATNGLMPLEENNSFIAWACASDSVVEAFKVTVSTWHDVR